MAPGNPPHHKELLSVHPPNDPALGVSLCQAPPGSPLARPGRLQQAHLCGRAPIRQEPKPLTALLGKQVTSRQPRNPFSLRVLRGTHGGERKAEMKRVKSHVSMRILQHCAAAPRGDQGQVPASLGPQHFPEPINTHACCSCTSV